MASITVRFFAVLRERRGTDTEDIDVPDGSTVREVFESLFHGPERGLTVAFARNQIYARPDEVVEDGDEVAFLPPLGGG